MVDYRYMNESVNSLNNLFVSSFILYESLIKFLKYLTLFHFVIHSVTDLCIFVLGLIDK